MFVMPTIDMVATGKNIEMLRKAAGISVKTQRKLPVSFTADFTATILQTEKPRLSRALKQNGT